MELKESRRATGIQPSPTLTVSAKAARLRREGRDIVALSAGEPDFDTPERIKEAAARAMREGLTKYTPVDGLPELKRAITDKLRRENDLAYEDNQILVSCGCKHSIYNLAQALLDPGDEVIIPAPYWVSYPDITLLAGGHPALLYASNSQNFKLLPEQLAQAITGRTRLL
ncbi:MAG: aminotransferase class I/II-fold pyridoxal phosphate-dependent enzyme, partial [Gammaproteobacteria bacterium]|nr:aminotransferase class I/II-fold pyridoxal phosphate-dependent enzyme [Gammaproteobacteria bacterium]